MADEAPFVLPAKAPLYLGQKAPGAVAYGNEALAQARWVPHRGPGIVNLGKVSLQGASVNATTNRKDGSTLLHFSVWVKSMELTRFLIEHGVDAAAQDEGELWGAGS